jgi:hypothetical protein
MSKRKLFLHVGTVIREEIIVIRVIREEIIVSKKGRILQKIRFKWRKCQSKRIVLVEGPSIVE